MPQNCLKFRNIQFNNGSKTTVCPHTRIKNQFRINRENAFEWATVKGIKVSPQFISSSLKSPGGSLPSLMEAVTAGGHLLWNQGQQQIFGVEICR